MANEERQYIEDKVYLQGPDGQHWDYEPLLANTPGFTPVTPNPSKKAAAADKVADKPAK